MRLYNIQRENLVFKKSLCSSNRFVYVLLLYYKQIYCVFYYKQLNEKIMKICTLFTKNHI